ncbi:MAG: uracil-DNA glycosylase family protein [Chloroflexi bacterium]|nr:uracil-DNA glycosylase family protein [Chloroflexota bacterium]
MSFVANTVAATKRQKLAELKTRIEQHFADRQLWFFQDRSGRVAGYLGTELVMFVGQRPSTGQGGFSRLATDGASGFYSLLVEYGFADAHVTDLVEDQMKVGIPSDEQVDRNWPFFQEELEIIRPKVVVALGGWVHWILEHRIESLIPIERIMHYSYRFIRPPEREKRLREDLARIRRKVDATPGNCCREDDY